MISETSFATAIGIAAAMTGAGMIAMLCFLAVIDEVLESALAEETWTEKVKPKPSTKPKHKSKG